MRLDYDPGSICDGCPHPLDDHDLRFSEAGTLLLCEVKDCGCRQVWGAGRPLKDVSFNQEAQEALGTPAQEQGEQHGR